MHTYYSHEKFKHCLLQKKKVFTKIKILNYSNPRLGIKKKDLSYTCLETSSSLLI